MLNLRSWVLGIFLAVFLCLFANNSYAQFKNISFSAGLSTWKILGDNPSALPIVQRDTTKPNIIGGAFKDSQTGIEALVNIGLDSAGNFNIPIAFDYTFYRAYEKIPFAPGAILYRKHAVDVPSISLGFLYNFMKLPFANVKAYAGLEGRVSFIQQGVLVERIDYRFLDSMSVDEGVTKQKTTRYGAAIRLGFDGEIKKPIYINASFCFGLLNLFGKDDKRGELLTPTTLYETKESDLYHLNFSLRVEYRFN